MDLPEDRTPETAVDELYDRVSRYYNLQIQSIGPEEYKFIQDTIGYPESYEEHIQSLKDGINPSETTKEHIKEFVTKYPEFQHPQYVSVLDYIINILLTDQNKAKQAGMQALLQIQQQIQEQNADSETSSDISASSSDIPDVIPFQVGNGDVIELPSHQDPLLVSLYSVCMMAFSARVAGVRQSAGSCHDEAF